MSGSSSTASFGVRLDAAFGSKGHLCVGIDPHPYLVEAWGYTPDAEGARDFGLTVIEAVTASGRAGIVKPQVAFFEAHGSAGFRALEDVLAIARAAGLLVIGDAKRGDIGSTNDGYAAAWLRAGSPLEVDALTVTAFTGVGALSGLFDEAEAAGKGVFVLSATSNPESRTLQTARSDSGATVSRIVADEVAARNTDRTRLGDFGLVLGATKRLDEYGFTAESLRGLSTTPVLAPGFGFQGAEFSAIPHVFGPLAPDVIVAVSRSILEKGSRGTLGTAALADAITAEADALAEVIA
ncbi:orotidine-5'-phosphate decarboxylase [Herbiconiux sp. CPCC 203407]|uniref:Orotidine-5'-phosphate decarboxylase n=1 Tax=Herbiconiux oxytropis TaxID=2970915 RepID=A0AA42BV29_9MICO|nr:orotidine-5'-phosphate decarboxylase [Herbiconiux oxytropis]MCS5720416.1 orotidine-5'-phosphate decarboxylase [Herbiconiux oxytropis]MCS5725989.1 orotidine-5'-phosphate decarboxylase [Herbiconiux oxytropis]